MYKEPKQSKFKKIRKGKLKKLEFKANKLNFGSIGLKAVESGMINSRQIEAARQAISRKIKKRGKVWIRIFPDLPISSKPSGVRMGKGKGNTSHWVARVAGGTTLFELCGTHFNVNSQALKSGGKKLPVKTKIFY